MVPSDSSLRSVTSCSTKTRNPLLARCPPTFTVTGLTGTTSAWADGAVAVSSTTTPAAVTSTAVAMGAATFPSRYDIDGSLSLVVVVCHPRSGVTVPKRRFVCGSPAGTASETADESSSGAGQTTAGATSGPSVASSSCLTLRKTHVTSEATIIRPEASRNASVAPSVNTWC